MSKRKRTNIRILESEIIAMRSMGKSRQEIADALHLERKQIENWVSRHNREEARILSGGTPKHESRLNQDGEALQQNEKQELERLRMENKLLRDFLQSAGRR